MSVTYHSKSYLAIIVLLQACCMVTALRLKIAVEKTVESDTHSSRTKRSVSESACSNYYKISTKSIPYPYGRPKPWERPPAATYVVSETVTQGMEKALQNRVPGLGETTVADVFYILKQHGCITLPFGGCVRDQFLGSKVLDIDADTPCQLDTVVDICKKYWDEKYCIAPVKKAVMQIVHIGKLEEDEEGEVMDLAHWNKTFFGELTNLEYTTNSLAYYNGTNTSVVIDLTGSGINDTCNKTIRIPVPRDQWNEWYDDDTSKIFRYWKLRAKGYTAKDEALPSFIKNTTKEILSSEFGVKLFKKSFCKYAFSGEYCYGRKTCTIPHPDCVNSGKKSEKRNRYYTLYKEVLDEFWEEEAKAMLDKVYIECPYGNSGSNNRPPIMLIGIGVAISHRVLGIDLHW